MKRSSLNPSIKRKIKDTEKLLGTKCYKICEQRNPFGMKVLYGRFGKVKEDNTIVTLAYEDEACIGGWNPFI